MFRNESANNSQIDRRLIACQQNESVDSMVRELLDAQANRAANAARPIFISHD
jgi:hypothetical protein